MGSHDVILFNSNHLPKIPSLNHIVGLIFHLLILSNQMLITSTLTSVELTCPTAAYEIPIKVLFSLKLNIPQISSLTNKSFLPFILP